MGHANINVGGITFNTEDTAVGRTNFITSFNITTSGDYLVAFASSTNDAGGNTFALVKAIGGSVVSPGAGTTTATLTGFSAFNAMVQGTQVKITPLSGIVHLLAGDKIYVVNVGSSHAQLNSNIASVTATASVTFLLLNAN